jgi:hypothetical protein
MVVLTPTQFCWCRRGWEEDEREPVLLAAAKSVLLSGGRTKAPILLPDAAPCLEFTCNWKYGWLEVHQTLLEGSEETALIAAIRQAWCDLMRR